LPIYTNKFNHMIVSYHGGCR